MFILLRVAKELANAGPGTDSAEEMAREELAAFSLPRFGLLSWLWAHTCSSLTSTMQLCPAPFPRQNTAQSDPIWSMHIKASRLKQNLNFTAWILRKLKQESAGEGAVLNSPYLPNFPTEIKYPYIMAQSFLAQWSVWYNCIHRNEQQGFHSWWEETFCSIKVKPGKSKAKQKVSFLARWLLYQSSLIPRLPVCKESIHLWNGPTVLPGKTVGHTTYGLLSTTSVHAACP